MPRTRPRPRARAIPATLALAVLLTTLATPGHAVVRNWNNAAGGSAGTSTNWNPVGVPGAADNLLYNILGTCTIDFPASVPQVISHAFNGGTFTLTTSSPHTCTSSWAVNGAKLTLSGANVKVGSHLVTSNLPFTLTSSGGFPSIPTRFEVTDSTQATIIANTGLGRMDVFGGSQYVSGANSMFLGNTATARCTLNVAGFSSSAFQPSLVLTTSPTHGNLWVGGLGAAVVNISNGGEVHTSGQTVLGNAGTGSGQMTLTGNVFVARLVSDGPLRIGGNAFTSQLGGSGLLTVNNNSVVNANGLLQLGDSDGGPGGTLLMNGGTCIAANGITKAPNGNLVLSGGLVHMTGGKLTWPAGEGMTIGGPGSPQFWVDNRQTNDLVNGPITGLFVGFYPYPGTLRVTGPGTLFGTAAGTPCYVSSLSGTPGTLVVDTLAVLSVGSVFDAGELGPATVEVTGGAQLRAGSVNFGGAAADTTLARVQGPGSMLRFTDRLTIGGPGSVPGAFVSVVVDSGALVSDSTSAAAGSSATVQGPQGNLVVSRGSLFRADTLHVFGTAGVRDGFYAVGHVFVDGSGVFGGRGAVTGSLANSNVTHVKGDTGTFGDLTVGGAFSQAGLARLRLGLGYAGGPVNDRLLVSGNASLGGILALESDASFVHVVGDSFTVMTYGSHTGTFDGLMWNGNYAGQLFDLVYLPNRLVAVVKTSNVGVGPGTGPLALRLAVRENGRRPELALDLPASTQVRLELFDAGGRRVASLADGTLSAGQHAFALDGSARGIAAGVYFARAVIGGGHETRTVRVNLLR